MLDTPGASYEDVAVADGVVWAVGYSGHRKAYPIVSTWDGASWTTTVAPERGKHDQVVARTRSEVWISGLREGRWALHTFDGAGWTTKFRAVDFANSANPRNVWMSEGRDLIRISPDGSENRVTVPSSMDFYGRYAVDSRGGVWLYGDDRYYRWLGQRWAQFPSPANSSGAGIGMAASTPKDVWGVGNSIEHWDGSSWKLLPHGGEAEVMHDADALNGKALVGGQDWGRQGGHGVIAEWNGTKWRRTVYLGTRKPAPYEIYTVEAINGVAFDQGGGRRAWAVGYGDTADNVSGVVFRGTCQW